MGQHPADILSTPYEGSRLCAFPNRAREEAALDRGANYWQTFWRITVPNLKLSIIGAALFST